MVNLPSISRCFFFSFYFSTFSLLPVFCFLLCFCSPFSFLSLSVFLSSPSVFFLLPLFFFLSLCFLLSQKEFTKTIKVLEQLPTAKEEAFFRVVRGKEQGRDYPSVCTSFLQARSAGIKANCFFFVIFKLGICWLFCSKPVSPFALNIRFLCGQRLYARPLIFHGFEFSLLFMLKACFFPHSPTVRNHEVQRPSPFFFLYSGTSLVLRFCIGGVVLLNVVCPEDKENTKKGPFLLEVTLACSSLFVSWRKDSRPWCCFWFLVCDIHDIKACSPAFSFCLHETSKAGPNLGKKGGVVRHEHRILSSKFGFQNFGSLRHTNLLFQL